MSGRPAMETTQLGKVPDTQVNLYLGEKFLLLIFRSVIFYLADKDHLDTDPLENVLKSKMSKRNIILKQF